ncbi:MAG: tetratricopeptide repeat protein [Chloroflexi bacterium]|nr:tetratricopeptide repeat protein [Chloroflexota bacterium]
MPLAIELAATRVSALGLEQLSARLADRFIVLTTGSRTAVPRQQTLRATLDWSYALLSEPEQRLFQRLAVFSGGWTLEAAEVICVGDGIERGDVFELLAQLVDKSLVGVQDGFDGEVRYRLLEMVREYARMWLANSGHSPIWRRAHAVFFIQLAEENERELHSRDQRRWLDRLASEQDNLREALAWALECGEFVEGLRLGVAMLRFWTTRAHLSEGSRWLDALLAASDRAAVPPTLRARVLGGSGQLAFARGDLDGAAARFQASLSLYYKGGDESGVAAALRNLGRVAQSRGDYPRAAFLYQRALDKLGYMNEKYGVADCLDDLGEVARHRGEYDRAEDLDRQALALQRELGDLRGVAYSLNELANVACHRGDYERGIALCEEALALQRELGDKRSSAWSIYNLGLIVQAQGNYDRALRLYEEALSLFREVGDLRGISSGTSGLSDIARTRGDLQSARELLEQAMQMSSEVGEQRAIALCIDRLAELAETLSGPLEAAALHRQSLVVFIRLEDQRGIIEALEGLGRSAALEGEYPRAARWFGAAAAIRRRVGGAPSRTEDSVVSVRDRLGRIQFEKHWGAGLSLESEVLFAEVLSS